MAPTGRIGERAGVLGGLAFVDLDEVCIGQHARRDVPHLQRERRGGFVTAESVAVIVTVWFSSGPSLVIKDQLHIPAFGGSMGWLPVGLNVMATLFSSNSFVF